MYWCLILNDWETMNNFFIWVIKGPWKFIWTKSNIVSFLILWVFLLFIINEKCARVKNPFYNDNDYNNVKYALSSEKKYNSTRPEKNLNLNFTEKKRKLKQLWIFLPLKLSLFEITSCIYEFFPLQNFPCNVIHFEKIIKWIFFLVMDCLLVVLCY